MNQFVVCIGGISINFGGVETSFAVLDRNLKQQDGSPSEVGNQILRVVESSDKK